MSRPKVKKTKKRHKSKTGWPARHFVFGAWTPHVELEEVRDQLWWAWRYRRGRTWIKRWQLAATAALLRERCPYFLDAENAYKQAAAAVDAIDEFLSRKNQLARSRVATDADRDRKKELVAARSQAKRELSAAKRQAAGSGAARKRIADNDIDPDTLSDAEWREAYGDPDVYTPLREIDARALAAKKRLLQRADLPWGTYQTVDAAFQAAVSSSAKFGKPPRFPRHNADQAIAIHDQKSGIPWIDAISGKSQWLHIRIVPPNERPIVNARGRPVQRPDPQSKRTRLKPLIEVSLRIGSDGRKPIWTKFYARLHRTPPADAVVKWAYLRQRRVGPRPRWEFDLVLQRPDWDREQARYGSAGIDVGWRLLRDGQDGMRVAYLVDDTGAEQCLVIPPEHLADWERVTTLQRAMTTRFNETRALLAQWMQQQGGRVPAWLVQATRHMHTWKKISKLSRVAWLWQDRRIDGDGYVFHTLDEWRKWNRQTYYQSARLSKRAVARRNDQYRKFAIWVARTYHTLRVEDTNWAELLRRPGPESRESKEQARRYSRIGAVGTLRRYLHEAVAEVREVEAAFTTLRCHGCGVINSFDAASNLFFQCSHCGEVWDQDMGAALNIRDELPDLDRAAAVG